MQARGRVGAALAAVVVAAVLECGPPVAAQPVVVYAPPVDAPVVDHFRPPATRWGPGNRGVDYRLAPLTPVRAAADGRVVFAGPVGGTLHVTVLHADGLRTSYSFLAAVTVSVGRDVVRGETLGLSGDVLHLGVRTPDGTYLDPESLFAGPVEVHLVPGGDDGTGGGAERALLADEVASRLGALASMVGAASIEDVRARLALLEHVASSLVADPVVRAVGVAAAWAWAQRDCTPADAPTPRVTGRRVLVLVGGLGSTSGHVAVDDLDPRAVGYAPGDVVRFSYAGGRIPADGLAPPLAAVAARPYGAADSQGDLVGAAERLGDLLEEIARSLPGVPVDVVAHSQGGVVARLAIQRRAAAGRLPGEVATLVTLGTPHGGADLATAVSLAGTSPGADAALGELADRLHLDLDPRRPAIGQLAETSPVIGDLRRGAWPPSVRLTSIGARGDLVVPAPRTLPTGADGVPVAASRATVVPVTGVDAHGALPGAAAARREVALAVAGRGPTCRPLATLVADALAGELVAAAEDRLGSVLALGVPWPSAAPVPLPPAVPPAAPPAVSSALPR